MEKGSLVTITQLVPEYKLKKGDTGKYIKSINMGNGFDIDLHRVEISGKEYQLRTEEFTYTEDLKESL